MTLLRNSEGPRWAVIRTFAVAVLVATSSSAAVIEQRDEYKKTSSLLLRPDGNDWEKPACSYPAFAFSAEISDKSGKLESLLVLTAARCVDWTYLKCHDLAFLVGESPIQVDGSAHSGKVENGGVVLENVVAPLSRSQLSALASSRVPLRAKQCSSEVTFKEEDMASLAEFDTKLAALLKEEIPFAEKLRRASLTDKLRGECTQGQVDGMKALGLRKDQIQAACRGLSAAK